MLESNSLLCSVDLILKQDPRITNFPILDPGIKISIPGLQSLLCSCGLGSRRSFIT